MKIALVASGPTRHLAPYQDFTYKIWANAPWFLFGEIPRADMWFEMHDFNNIRPTLRLKRKNYSKTISSEEYFNKLLPKIKEPIMMQSRSDSIPASIEYPLDLVIKEFGSIFTSSASYMLGLALLNYPTELGIYGIHMDSKKEYRKQRDCFEYMLGLAESRGIKLIIPTESKIKPKKKLTDPTKILYAYDWQSELAWWNKKNKRKKK